MSACSRERSLCPANVSSVTDRLGRPVARVGPVRPGYICYQDRGSLVALDPLSGKPLWRRTDVPSAELTDGDDALLVLVDRRAKRLADACVPSMERRLPIELFPLRPTSAGSTAWTRVTANRRNQKCATLPD